MLWTPKKWVFGALWSIKKMKDQSAPVTLILGNQSTPVTWNYFLGWPESPRRLFFFVSRELWWPKTRKTRIASVADFFWVTGALRTLNFWVSRALWSLQKKLHWARHTRDCYHRGRFYIYFYKKSQVPNLKNDWAIDVLDFGCPECSGHCKKVTWSETYMQLLSWGQILYLLL